MQLFLSYKQSWKAQIKKKWCLEELISYEKKLNTKKLQFRVNFRDYFFSNLDKIKKI